MFSVSLKNHSFFILSPVGLDGADYTLSSRFAGHMTETRPIRDFPEPFVEVMYERHHSILWYWYL